MNRIVVAIISLAFMLNAVLAAAGPTYPDCCSPKYNQTAMDSYRKLQFKTSTCGELPEYGQGIRLGIYQAQAAWGPGGWPRN